MRPICTVVDGLPSEGTLSSFPGPVSVYEMSMLRALDPVQTWLGQELEKCGIDAMIYTRYVLSLLLHDSYDYDLQEQENDIFLGWEKGACKKWGKGKRKSSDLSMEEMKKQAAVQCLLSASDESSGIETLVEELCSKLKDLQSSQGEQLPITKEKGNKKVFESLSPEATSSPARKDQAEMYYEAFPPLSEKTICLQEIMTVWNKSKIGSYSSSSSSSTAPQTSTETPSPKNCHSETETLVTSKNNGASDTVQERIQQRKGKTEKESKTSNGANEEKTIASKSVRHKSSGKIRPRSWSSGSSEAGSSSSGNQDDMKARLIKVRHKVKEVRSKKGKTGTKIPSKKIERKKAAASSSTGSVKPLCKRAKRTGKKYVWKDLDNEGNDIFEEGKNETKFREEPLWYTEPITEYFIPLNSKSKLETAYKKNLNWYNTPEEIEELSEIVKDLRLNNHNIHEKYLAGGTFIKGHFVEMPAVVTETSDHTRTSNCSLQEDNYLDDVHPLEFTHFYEVEIDQSMLDPGASDKMKGESRILNMIRQKSNVKSDFEAESCEVLDKDLQGGSAIWTESTSSIGAEDFFLQDHSKLAQFWEAYSPSSSADADGESLGGDSPNTFSPFLDSTMLSTHTHAGNQDLFLDGKNSYFSVFEVQCSNSVFPLPRERVLNEKGRVEESCSSTSGFGRTQSRLLIWTKNSAFDENEQCSNLSTRTCSPWSHSDGTRSDTEALNNSHVEDYSQLNTEQTNYIIPRVTLTFQEECKSQSSFLHNRILGGESMLVLGNKSKLESLCGIQLEQETEEISDTTEVECENSRHKHGYSSGVIKDIWTNIDDQLFSIDVNTFTCHDSNEMEEAFQEPNRAVQRSEYHLWESQKDPAEKKAFLTYDSSKVDGGDYMTPSKSWDMKHVSENSFILGGVYGELKNFSGEDEWAVVPQSPTKASLLECAASDVVSIAGTDVFMSPGNSFAPGHRQIWRPFVSFEDDEQSEDKSSNKGFFILHEDLLRTCDNFQLEEPGMGYFSSFELNNRFSQVLHVECSFEPGNLTSSSPNFKTKALCSDSESDVGHPRICGVERTPYRSIRISPRTHFRPIPASELSPGVGSESDSESEKDEVVVPTLSEGEVFEDPQDNLKPLEEDAENEGNFYGKSELESGKFLPRLQKSGMEKSAQTSLDGQEESLGMLSTEKQDNLDFKILESFESNVLENSKPSFKALELKSKQDVKGNLTTGYNSTSQVELGEYPSLSTDLWGVNAVTEKQCWWQKALYSSLHPGSCCDSLYTNVEEESRTDSTSGKEIPSTRWHPLDSEKMPACNDAKVSIGYGAGMKSSCFRKIYSSDSSSSDTASNGGGHEWADICREELFSRTQL
ncbi:uncharacterized protein KIAA0232 homolog isoform X2 [Pseudophryne corroboree]|uniref:uncharacterized protein KIAA0232 homolog isoform X2 n=1 Tax=Pseudophryne corroboree TaxID=495146 RepID=UPI003081933D